MINRDNKRFAALKKSDEEEPWIHLKIKKSSTINLLKTRLFVDILKI